MLSQFEYDIQVHCSSKFCDAAALLKCLHCFLMMSYFFHVMHGLFRWVLNSTDLLHMAWELFENVKYRE
jgi:hypothetical protein